ncbi:MAG: lipid-A-disaccharide synthase [Pseudobdellovibrionaceae bacterium]
MKSVLIVAAEASSAPYAKKILQLWQSQGEDIQAFGVGTLDMEQIGFERLGKSEEMAVVGAAEIIAQYSHLKSVFDSLVSAAALRKPKVAILMDYPEFNLMLSKRLHQLGIAVVYYISPQIWAWRQGRVETIKKYCKKVFVIFPFEIPFYEKHQVPCEFVGHPLLEDLDEKLFDPIFTKTHRHQVGLQDQDVVLGLMPGSRRLELKQHFSIQLQVARKMMDRYPDLKLVIMVAPTFEKEQLLPYLEDFRRPYILLKDDPYRMIHLSDLVLVASGTATLMVGLLLKPMVIMYRMQFVTWLFAKIFVRGTRFFGLVNLILGKQAVPERLQGQANVEELTACLSRYLDDENYKNQVVQDLSGLQSYLGNKGATEKVVRSLKEFLQ